MKRWTVEELESLDDLTFAMRILSERRGNHHPKDPISKKLSRAYQTLDELRGGRPLTYGGDVVPIIRQRFYNEVNQSHELNDIESKMREMEENGASPFEKITVEQVLADTEIMSSIKHRFDKDGPGEDYWYIIENAVETGIRKVLERRGEA